MEKPPRLLTLGQFGLQHPSGGGEALAPGKPLATLAYLACASSSRSAARSTLLSHLWADLEPDAARHALRQTLWYLKKRVGYELILPEGDSVRLVDSVTVDRDDLLDASRAGDHATVVECYAGPFIPDYAAPGGSGFEEWAALERRRLHEIFRHSATIRVRSLLSSGRNKEARALAKRLRDEDVNDEGGWRLLMEACTTSGDVLAARAEAEALADSAVREGFDLEPATRAAIRAARGSWTRDVEKATAETPTLTPSLVGREEAFAALIRAWDAAKGARPQRVHISARPGFGKTRLLRDLAARLRAVRAKVVTVGGSLGAREIAFAAAGDLAAAVAALPGRSGVAPESAATLVELNPAISSWFDQPPRRTAQDDPMRGRTAAVRELIAAVAFENPVAILIDDLHWWDDASATLLGAVLGTLGEARVLVVTAARPEARKLALLAGTTAELQLESLSQSQVEELVVSIATLPTAQWAQEFLHGLWRASRGSPLLIIGMLQHLEDRQLLSRVSGEWQSNRPEALEAEVQQSDVLRARVTELERDDLWLLTLIAVGRTTLPVDVLATAAATSVDALTGRLAVLESRGLVVRDGTEWRAAHDEIADEVLRTAAHDAAPRASAQLGAAILSAQPFSEHVVRRAALLLRAGGDASASSDLFRAFARHRFALGDRRSVTALAADLLGTGARPAEVQDMVRGTPLSWRLGLVSTSRRLGLALAGIASTVAALLLAWVYGPSRGAPPDAVLAVAYTDSLGYVSWQGVPVRQDEWAPQHPLAGSTVALPGPVRLHSSDGFQVTFAPATGAMITQRAVPDDESHDLFITDSLGAEQHIRSRGDDGDPVASPDGRWLAFSTARWDTLGRYDLALLRIGDSTPIQLTTGPSTDSRPAWSPDGAFIAFGRANWGTSPSELCVLRLDIRDLTCREARMPEYLQPIGWLDDDRILISSYQAARNALEVMHWSTGVRSEVMRGLSSGGHLRTDGVWVTCMCPVAPDRPPQLAVFPIEAPALIRPIVMMPGAQILGTAWRISTRTRLASRVQIRLPEVVAAGVPALMSAQIFDHTGRSLAALGDLRWHSPSQQGVRVDSITGEVLADRTRRSVTIVARAGHLVSDTVTIRVDTLAATTVFEERWQSLTGWYPNGAPAPLLGRHDDGTAVFLNNGDGSFYSGAYTTQSFDARRGLALEARVSTPVDRPQWQSLILGLVDAASRAGRASGVGQNAPISPAEHEQVCTLAYPEEGLVMGLRPTVTMVARTRPIQLQRPRLLTGKWVTLLLQYLPDGRCGFAIDGEAVAIISALPSSQPDLRVRIAGSSYKTRIAVGPLTVWEGVRTDIDWTKAPAYK